MVTWSLQRVGHNEKAKVIVEDKELKGGCWRTALCMGALLR